MNLGGFLQNVGLQAGYNEIYGVQQGLQKSDLELKQLAVKQGQMQLLQQAQIMKSREAIAKEQQAQNAISQGKVQSPMAIAGQYDRFAQQALASGDYKGATEYQILATNSRQQAKDAQLYDQKQKQAVSEDAGKAALTLKTNPTEQNYASFVAAMTRAGHGGQLPATFGDFLKNPGAAASLDAASIMGESTKDVLNQQEKQREFELKQRDQQRQFQQRRADTQAQLSMVAAMHDQTMAMQRDSLKLRESRAEQASADRRARLQETKSSNQFNEEQKVITAAEGAAKPVIEQYRTVNSALTAAKSGSPVLDQQLRQALPSLNSFLKGRATNIYYKDNANFGNVAQRAENALSRFATGKFSEADRTLIQEGLNYMQSQNIVDLNQQEKDMKENAAARGLDPSKVMLPGNFPRVPSDALGTAVTPDGSLTYAVKGADGNIEWYTLGGSK